MDTTNVREGAVASARAGARVGRFELREALGEGSTGRVYLAWDPFLAAEVALKVFDPLATSFAAADGDLARQFMSEASLVGKLTHPHIASIFEASAGNDPAYIAMEYVSGGNLAKHATADSLLAPERLMQIAFKTCGALDYASQKGIVHRDVKPANLLLSGDTHVKVADFGAARLKGAAQSGPTSPIGSPAYMSPEQFGCGELGPQSDMFSLGVSLYELLTGQRPFVGANLPHLMNLVLNHQPQAPSAVRPGIERRIDDMVLRMLAKDPAARYASWADLALDIAEVGRLGIAQREVPDSERYETLRALPVLGNLDDAGIWELVHAGRWRQVTADSVLVREGEPGRSLFFLARGQAKVTRQGRLLGVLGAGEYFGEMAFVKNGAIARQATVEAITDVLFCEFDPELLRYTSSNCRLQLSHALLDNMVERLQIANERLVSHVIVNPQP